MQVPAGRWGAGEAIPGRQGLVPIHPISPRNSSVERGKPRGRQRDRRVATTCLPPQKLERLARTLARRSVPDVGTQNLEPSVLHLDGRGIEGPASGTEPFYFPEEEN